jgi:hypothetical protein
MHSSTSFFAMLRSYNDAASRALGALHQQFLFDEIEAETNLSFDQLIFHLSEGESFATLACLALFASWNSPFCID